MLSKTGPVQFFLAPLLGLIVFPFLTVTFLLNEIIRFIVSQILFVVHGSNVELVSDGADGFWGYKREGSTRNVIVYVMTPVGTLDHDKLANFYREQIQSHRNKEGIRPFKKFEKVLTILCGYFCWKNVDFKIENHIRVLNAKKVFKPRDLQEMLTEFGEDMDESKPQWELILCPRYDDGTGTEKSILFARLLHCYMDGLSFMMLFKEHLTPSMEYTIDPLNFHIPKWKKVLFYINTLIYGPFFSITMLLEKYFKLPWILREEDKPRKKYYAWVSSKSRTVSDDTIRKIRTHAGNKATVTNVLSTALVSAITTVLPKERIVDEILVSELIAYLPYPDPNPQNRIAYFTFGIHSKEEDIWDKLRKCRYDSLNSMMGPEVLTTFYSFKLAGRLPAFLSPIWLQGSAASVLLSNVPFSRGKVTFRDGTPVLEMAGFTPHPNDLGLSMTTTRYGDEIKIFACADSTWLSQEELTNIINQIPVEILNMVEDIETEDLQMKAMYKTIAQGENDNDGEMVSFGGKESDLIPSNVRSR